ncbi:Syntaxin-4 [Lucilia cuprina]|nr:Syntaxin-4 [Lucilia cuprina]
MIRDRLPELKEVGCTFHASTESLVLIEIEDVEEEVVRSHSPVMDALLKMYNEILLEIEQILQNIETMKVMTQAKNAKNFKEKEFYKLRQTTIQIGNNIMSKFQLIESTLPPENNYTTLARMKRSLYYGFFQHYVIIWSKNDEFFHEYENKLKKNLQMQSKILNYDLTEEEIETLVAHKQTTLYTGNILETEHARKTLQALKDRLGELKKLEKSIEEVHTLFLRLQNLVVHQSVIMQRIEKHFDDARNYVEEGTKEIKEAEIIQKKTQKKKMIKIKDRLPDFKKNLQIQDVDKELSNYEVIVEEEPELEYKPYNGPVGNLLKRYLYIHVNIKEIENLLLNMKSMTTAEHINNFNQKEFNKLRADSIKIGNDIIKRFKKLESKLPDPEDSSTLARMKRTLYFGFFQQYILLWSKNEQFLMDFEQKLKKRLQMQSQILNCNLSNDDIETLIENKNTNLFMSNILQDTETERKTLQELQDRFEDLKKLEKSITEVHNLFISLQTLVAEQGDAIQRIETHFNAARDYIEDATRTIEIVEKMKKQRCCRICCCF